MELPTEHVPQLPKQPEAAEPKPAPEIIGLKEVLSMMQETLGSDSEMLDLLQSIIDQPEPDSDDPAAEEEYRAQMEFVKGVALTTQAKTERTEEMMQQIKEILAKLKNP